MATNQTRDSFLSCWHKSATVTHPTTPLSGQPCRIGLETGMCLTDEGAGGNTSTETTVDTGPFRAKLSVKGVNDSGNSAVAYMDPLYYVDSDVGDGTGFLSKKQSGVFFGFADETVGSGSTATINVWHIPSTVVGRENLPAAGIGASDLTTTLATGYIPLPLGWAREAVTNAIPNTAANGGLLASDTTPILERVNGATDKKQRINWAASNSDEITWDFPYPPDLDDTAAVTVNLLMVMAGATDTPTVAVSYFEGVGDTNAGGNTTALSNTLTHKTVTIAAGDVGAYPTGASVGVVVGAHTTDACYLYGAWITYTRK